MNEPAEPAKPVRKRTGRAFNRSGEAGGPNAAKAALAKAYRRFAEGNISVADFEMILADLANLSGYYRRPNYGEWMLKTKSPVGFELHSALSGARAEVVQHILDQVMLSDDDLVALERAARAEARR